MQISSCIDWITVSTIKHPQLAYANCKVKFKDYQPAKPIAHYPSAWKLKPAGTRYTGVTKKQGTLLQLSGQDLQVLRNEGFGEFGLLLELQKLGTCTRLDFAVDIKEPVDLHELEDAWSDGKHKTRFRKKPLIMETLGGKEGHTIYFGTSKADVKIRAYDKAAQLKVPDTFWTRIELQARRKRAKWLLDEMIENDWYDVGRDVIKRYINFPSVEWWVKAMESDNTKLSMLPARPDGWKVWMDEQVLRSIEKRLDSLDDMKYLTGWMEKVWEVVNKSQTVT